MKVAAAGVMRRNTGGTGGDLEATLTGYHDTRKHGDARKEKPRSEASTWPEWPRGQDRAHLASGDSRLELGRARGAATQPGL